MRTAVDRVRVVAMLVALVFRSDPWRALLSLTPVIPLSSGLSYLAAREVLHALPGSDMGALTRGAMVFTVAFGGTVWLGRVVRTTRIRLGELTVAEFNRRRVAAVLAPPGVEHLERPEYLDRLETLRSRLFEVQQTPRMLGWLVDSSGGIVVSALLLVSVDPLLGLVVLGGIPPALANSRAERRVDRVNSENASRNRRAAHLYDVATSPRDAKEVRVSGMAEELLARFADEWRASSGALLGAELRAGAIRSVGWVLQATAFAAGVVLLIGGVRDGEVTAGDVFVSLGAMAMVVGQFGQAAGGLSNIGRVSRLFFDLAALEAEAERSAPPPARTRPAPERLVTGLRLENVSFRYPGASADALREVDLALAAGSVVAVVGENGAGKSTLVKLLFGLYRPGDGRITVDGIDLADVDVDSWRSRTSACFQDFLRLELIARESVGAGDLAHVDDAGVVASAVDRAAATDTIATLPERLETQLGQRFGGAELSGGQWQKLAISRAMMRSTPLLLALDEPTGALDPLAEQQIFQTYTNQAKALGRATGAITVLVAHRFSTVRMADRIVVLDRGEVREVGDHVSLMAASGIYAELYELQAKHYR